MKPLCFYIGLACLTSFALASHINGQSTNTIAQHPYLADQQDGTYTNPVLFADYSDPDVVRVGDDYYMTASSFNCTPGLPILHSKDLINWQLINYAIDQVPGDQYQQVQHGCGVWAPSIRYHDNQYWIFFPTPDEGIYVTKAKDPKGQWSKPHLLLAGKGLIDPCPLWDDDGKAYLVHAYANSRSGIKHRLDVRPMSPDGLTMLGEGQKIYMNPEKHPTMEGPKFYKINGTYYIAAPAGGVANGWQVILRSDHVYGPYEDKTVLAQRDTAINGPHQGGLVQTPHGDWWFVHFQERQPYGRIVHVQPVNWQDGWPLMGHSPDENGVGKPVLRHNKPNSIITTPYAPATSDTFDQPNLGLQWQWHANHQDHWNSLTQHPGYLRLQTLPNDDMGQMPHFLAQKLPAQSFSATTNLRLAPNSPAETEAGLMISGRRHAAITLQSLGNEQYQVVYYENNQVKQTQLVHTPNIELTVHFAPNAICTFTYRVENSPPEQTIATGFKANEGRWIGAKIGLFARQINQTKPNNQTTSPPTTTTTYADFDHLIFKPYASKPST